MSILRIPTGLRTTGGQRFEFTESDAILEFDHLDGHVEITSSYSPGSIVVTCESLLQASEGFARRVLKAPAAEFPAIGDARAFRHYHQEILRPNGSDTRRSD